MWRHYFSCTDTTTLSESSRLQYEACQRATERFSKLENDIIRFIFSAPLAKNIVSIANDCASRFNLDVNKVYNTVNSANRAVAEERGLMEKEEK